MKLFWEHFELLGVMVTLCLEEVIDFLPDLMVDNHCTKSFGLLLSLGQMYVYDVMEMEGILQ